jgi:hypothetical protein
VDGANFGYESLNLNDVDKLETQESNSLMKIIIEKGQYFTQLRKKKKEIQ